MSRHFLGVMCFLLILGQGSFLHSARNICLIPSDRDAARSNWHYSPGISEDRLWLLQRIDKSLQEHNCTLYVSDLTEFLAPGGLQKLQKFDTFIFFNTPYWIDCDWQQRLFQKNKKKVIGILMEPPTTVAEIYAPPFLSFCDKVLTWDDSLVDNKKFFKFFYYNLEQMDRNLVPFHQKKLLTMVVAHKTSSHPKELYSERLKVIHYFEKQTGNDFEFYGYGWGKAGYRTYRGTVQDKHRILKQYRFSICYENMKDVQGYITEKIFDCFAAGCVPIYWGASNVTAYIPKNCFIARQNFASMDDLMNYLRNMKEVEYNHYLKNIRLFLESKQAQKFTQTNFCNTLVECLQLGDGK